MLFTQILALAVAVCAQPVKRATCEFPSDDDLVSVTPGSDNGGWAMSPDEPCTAGKFCPYACPPGKVMAQWDPKATLYSYPESMRGGLKCNSDGTTSKPFPNKPLCVDGVGNVEVKNTKGSEVNFCQTVLPGNEAMLIPTQIGGGSSKTIAVPGSLYWASTAAHYYINTPGVSTKDACQWGTSSKAEGNWAPYVGGTNQDSSGKTFVKIGWNPKYLDDFDGKKPSFGLKITCDDESKCSGLKCEIDPSNFNEVKSDDGSKGDGASFCVVTVAKGGKARIEVV